MNEAYKKTIDEIYKTLNVSKNGLDLKRVKEKQKLNGKNELVEKNKKTKLQIFLDQFKNIMIILLLVVGVLSLIYSIISGDDYLEPIVILGTSLINCFMGFLQESKAEDAIGKLKKYSANYITVKRNGKYKEIDSKNLVVGDYLVLEAGDKIPADARIVESYFGKVDESILTGESLSVDKTEETITENVTISERKNMVYSGTVLVAGKIEAIVVAIGMDTELGKIASVMDTREEPITPLQMKVQKISKFITIVACVLISFVLVFGIINDYDVLSLVMLCISMIVASVPECLPIAITATLSIGVNQMAKKKSIVRNLAAIETLGATEVICTDKTGTLTENKMEVIKIFEADREIELHHIKEHQRFIEIIDYCNTAVLNENGTYNGDAVDVALKDYLKNNNVKGANNNKIIELPFDSNRKMMSTVYEVDGENILYTKGSFESILQRSTKVFIDGKVVKLTKDKIEEYKGLESYMSKEALKVLAFAYKEIDKNIKNENDYFKEESDLVLVGLIGLKDPVRKNIKESISTCLNAHIRPIMLTGDNLPTATAIAKEVGICKDESECINATELSRLSEKELIQYINKYSVFARVSPENKLQIVKAIQKTGKVVAMTGDGVNDAPAIKLANVGIGMGKSGTDVTKDVSDIILLDDSFNTITTAVSEGRRIYDNVITNILYNLSSNFTEICIILFGMLTGNTIISAIHVLYIDLVADTIPSITLAFEGASKDVMARKPNGLSKRIFTKFFSAFLIISVILETLISLFVYYHFIDLGQSVAQTLALLSVVINEFVFAYNCRSLKEQIHKRGLFSNKHLNIGILVLVLVQLLVFFTPIGKIFGLTIITIPQLLFVILVNIVSFVIIELLKPIIVKKFKDE
ncbi:MAG: cation-translocating P-type ATPase [Bacilli bacterium]|nr:cation-translocating P-type ATPase [Bacilli bacterium]